MAYISHGTYCYEKPDSINVSKIHQGGTFDVEDICEIRVNKRGNIGRIRITGIGWINPRNTRMEKDDVELFLVTFKRRLGNAQLPAHWPEP